MEKNSRATFHNLVKKYEGLRFTINGSRAPTCRSKGKIEIFLIVFWSNIQVFKIENVMYIKYLHTLEFRLQGTQINGENNT